MASPPRCILTLNGGSSSLRFALFEVGETLQRGWHGKIDRIGTKDSVLNVENAETGQRDTFPVAADDPTAAAKALLDWLDARHGLGSIDAVGHRLVHGMGHSDAQRITPALLDELRGIASYDPDHLPAEIGFIELVRQHHPDQPQIACFDTAFHHVMPRVAQMLAIPRRYESKGLRRYGFHGLSYAFLLEEIARIAGIDAARGRIVLAHLGNGASMTAVSGGQSLDTSMGFTPTSGIPMGTRSGDLDPGIAAFLQKTEQMTPAQFDAMVNHASGLLGVSETSADMRELLANEATDVRSAEAVALFCYQAKKCLGAYAAVLGGLDTLVFAGGVGENAAPVRARICAGLEFLGIELDPARNASHAAVISTEASRVTVRVIRTDEELMIARSVLRVLSDPATS